VSDGADAHLKTSDREVAMQSRVSAVDVRRRHGAMLNRVSVRRDEVIIERKRKPLAALVERLEQMRRFARRHALGLSPHQWPSNLSDTQASELASAAKRWARKSKSRRTAK